jgi:hypothetical protein
METLRESLPKETQNGLDIDAGAGGYRCVQGLPRVLVLYLTSLQFFKCFSIMESMAPMFKRLCMCQFLTNFPNFIGDIYDFQSELARSMR